MVQNSHEYRREYWATRLPVHSFPRTAHSFTCSILLALFAHSAALIHLLTRLLTHSRAHGEVNQKMFHHKAVLNHSAKGDREQRWMTVEGMDTKGKVAGD